MLVDDDHQTYTFWKAQPNATQDLVPIGRPVCSPSVTPPPSTPTTPSIVHSVIQRATVSKGAIAGSVVGALAGIALFLAAFFVLKRRRTRKRRDAAAVEAAQKRDSDESPFYKPELPSDKQPPQELPLGQDLGYQVSPYELHDDRSQAHEMLAIPSKGQAVWPPEMSANPNKELPLSPQEMPAFRDSRRLSTLRVVPPMGKRKPVMSQVSPI